MFSSAIRDSLDWSVDPCNDFYNFSCNKWLSEHDIPSSQRGIDQYGRVAQDNYEFLMKKLQNKDIIKKYENVSWNDNKHYFASLLNYSP